MELLWTKWSDYQPVEKVGQGAYGSVYKAVRKGEDGDTFCAIKVISVPPTDAEFYSIKSEGYTAEQANTYFKKISEDYVRETEVMQTLSGNKNIVGIDDCYVAPKESGVGYNIFIKMEYLTPLSEWIENNRLTEDAVLKIGADISSALEACREHNIIHRDIKPDNILCDSEGNFKLGDFGIARSLENVSGSLTRVGTENYMAPEVVSGGGYDTGADIYSLGLVMYSLLNNRRLPFWPEGKQIISANERHKAFLRRVKGENIQPPKNASKKTAALILKACAFSRRDRFSSPSQMKEKIEKILNPTTNTPKIPFFKRKIFKFSAAAVLILLLMVSAAFGMSKLFEENTSKTYEPRADDSNLNSGVPSNNTPALNTPPVDEPDEPTTPTIPTEPDEPDEPTEPIAPPTPNEPDEPTEPIMPHTHQWDNGKITREATCKEEGIKTFTCSCGETKTEPIEKLTEHQYDNGVVNGNAKIYTCAVCGETKSEALEPHIHKWDNEEITRKATCKEEGVKTLICSCGETKTEPIEKLTEHQYDNGVVNGNTKTYTCAVCGEIKTETVQSPEPTTPTTPIEPNEPEPTVPSTPDEPVTPDTPDEPTPHTHGWGNGSITLAATCKDAGVMTYTCSVCGDTKTETIAKLTTHAYDNGTVSGNIKTYTCTVCGATKTETVENSQPTTSDITKYLTYTVSNGGATITGVNTSVSGDITIPATLGGYPVTCIGYEAFRECKSLTSVIIPDSVTTIDEYAFFICSGLTSVTIPDSVTTIGGSAFRRCDKLADSNGFVIVNNILFDYKGEGGKVVIPDGIKTISSGAFINNPKVIEIIVPDSVTEICSSAFSGSIVAKVNIPDGVTSIARETFAYCYGLKSLVIPDSVESIGNRAFDSCTGLTDIIIGSGVTSIGSSAFYDCTNLTNVKLPAGLTNIGINMFNGCGSLTSMTIPDSVTSIGDWAFQGCSRITELTIGNNVNSIGINAFDGCSQLTSINIPISVESIGVNAFKDCSNLTIYAEAKSQPTGWITYWNPSDRPVVWGYGASSEPDTSMYTYTISNGAATITKVDTAISGDITIPSTLDGYPVTEIDNSAFAYCNNLTSVTIPDSVTSIDSDAFNGCSNLISVNIGKGATVIPQYAFANCTRLSSITLPDNITSIGGSAFEGCENLQEVNLGSNVTTIGAYTFWGCVSLKQIIIPKNVTVISEYAFEDCYDLIIYAEAESQPTGWDPDWNSDCTVVWGYGAEEPVVPPAPAEPDPLMYSYRVSGESAIITATSPTLSGNVTIPSTLDGYPVKGIEKDAFNNRTGITYVTIPDSINYIGEYAFSRCKGLKGVTIGNNLFSIYGNAFRGCSSLESINIPEKVTYIGTQAFYDCTSLKEVSITNLDAWFGIEFGSKDSNPLFYGGGLYLNGELVTCLDVGDGITAIKDYAFAGSSLSEVVIGDSVKTIGFDAFAHCKNLRSVIIGENVITIYPSSLYECSGLSSIEVAPENISYMSVDNVLFTKDGKVLVAYAASKPDDTYVIPSGTEAIGYWAFGYCTSLKKLVIPRSVLSVDESAIWKCSGLTIYCEASQQPDSWYKNWNRENYSVVWGYFI